MEAIYYGSGEQRVFMDPEEKKVILSGSESGREDLAHVQFYKSRSGLSGAYTIVPGLISGLIEIDTYRVDQNCAVWGRRVRKHGLEGVHIFFPIEDAISEQGYKYPAVISNGSIISFVYPGYEAIMEELKLFPKSYNIPGRDYEEPHLYQHKIGMDEYPEDAENYGTGIYTPYHDGEKFHNVEFIFRNPNHYTGVNAARFGYLEPLQRAGRALKKQCEELVYSEKTGVYRHKNGGYMVFHRGLGIFQNKLPENIFDLEDRSSFDNVANGWALSRTARQFFYRANGNWEVKLVYCDTGDAVWLRKDHLFDILTDEGAKTQQNKEE